MPCEEVTLHNYNPEEYAKMCFMQTSTVIYSPDFEISTPRDEEMRGIMFYSNPRIVYLPVDTFKNFPNLEVYEAGRCSIKMLRKRNFQDLKKLKTIYLGNNKIETIYSDTFEGLTALDWIALSEFFFSIFIFSH